MISLEEAWATVDRLMAGRTLEAERLRTREALGRVLAEDAVARLELPPFRKSAMDGYAVLEGDRRETYRVTETVPAGRVPSRKLEPGTAIKIMTGAPVPEGAGRVIVIEDVRAEGDAIHVLRQSESTNICEKAEDVALGQVVLPRGARLDALALANLVACGVSTVRVQRRLRMALLATGDEIVAEAEALRPGRIMDSNGPLLAGLAAEYGIEVALERIVPDHPAELTAALRQAADAADLVVLTGGVSAGDFDYAQEALKAAGFQVHFDRVAVQPGQPLTFASREGRVAVGLPGNPVSVFVGFHLFVLRAVAAWQGGRPNARAFQVPLGKEVKRRHTERTAFLPCVLNDQGQAEVVAFHGSAHLLALCGADGFLQVPRGVQRLPAGAVVAFYPLLLEKTGLCRVPRPP
jgi:molybdopterin molybdotransferase